MKINRSTNTQHNGAGDNSNDTLTIIVCRILIRRHLRRLDAISHGMDIRNEFCGCRATKLGRAKQMAKSLASEPNIGRQRKC